MKFEKIIIPPGWQDTFTKYPNGKTIFEALSHTITSVNESIDEVNQKVNQGLVAISQAENTIRTEITQSFNTLKLQLEGEIDSLSVDLLSQWTAFQISINSQLADKVQKFKIKNDLINGSFENGTNGWKYNALIDVAPDFTIDSSKSKVGVASARLVSSGNLKSSMQEINCAVGDKIYYRAWVNRESGAGFLLYALPKGAVSGALSTAMSEASFNALPANVWTAFSSIVTATNLGLRIAFGRLANTTATANFDGFLSVNLTSIFGAGNEPTKLEMDELMKVIPDGWWDGELSLTQKQYMTWLLNLQRKNTNAIIALGGTII